MSTFKMDGHFNYNRITKGELLFTQYYPVKDFICNQLTWQLYWNFVIIKFLYHVTALFDFISYYSF